MSQRQTLSSLFCLSSCDGKKNVFELCVSLEELGPAQLEPE